MTCSAPDRAISPSVASSYEEGVGRVFSVPSVRIPGRLDG